MHTWLHVYYACAYSRLDFTLDHLLSWWDLSKSGFSKTPDSWFRRQFLGAYMHVCICMYRRYAHVNVHDICTVCINIYIYIYIYMYVCIYIMYVEGSSYSVLSCFSHQVEGGSLGDFAPYAYYIPWDGKLKTVGLVWWVTTHLGCLHGCNGACSKYPKQPNEKVCMYLSRYAYCTADSEKHKNMHDKIINLIIATPQQVQNDT